MLYIDASIHPDREARYIYKGNDEMSILTDNILKLGNFMVGEFYDVETKTPSYNEYRTKFIQAYGADSLQYMNSLNQFESYLWKDVWNAARVKLAIEKIKIPTGEFATNELVHIIWRLAHGVFVSDDHIRWGRYVHDGLITIDVMYDFKDNIFVTLLHIELTLK